jgi:hypothetical protein
MPISSSRATNKLTFVVKGNNLSHTKTITIPDNYYTPYDLAIMMSKLMVAITGLDIIVMYKPLSNKFRFVSHIASLSLLITKSGNIGHVLGFVDDTVMTKDITSPYNVDLSGCKHVHVKLSLSGNAQHITSSVKSSISFNVPVVCDYGDWICFDTEHVVDSGMTDPLLLNELKVQVFNEYGMLLDMRDDWSMLLEFV